MTHNPGAFGYSYRDNGNIWSQNYCNFSTRNSRYFSKTSYFTRDFAIIFHFSFFGNCDFCNACGVYYWSRRICAPRIRASRAKFATRNACFCYSYFFPKFFGAQYKVVNSCTERDRLYSSFL